MILRNTKTTSAKLTHRRPARPTPRARAGLLVPILALAPLLVGARGCNEAVVGDDCPSWAVDCGDAGAGGEPSDGRSCGGLRGLSCGAGEFCNYPIDAQCGAADQTGVCTAIPDACDLSYSPVCGCNGKTYSNACAAAAAGVSVAASGECGKPEPKACGGLRGLECGAGEFCNYPIDAQCGAADQTGVCTEIPQGCTTIYQPVCGCDGQTHGNSCSAASAGVSVAALGECEKPEPKACGGLRGLECDSAEFCNYPIDAQCGAADQTGVCEARPEACDDIYQPVCGCDDQTYSNACEAHAKGISVAAEGACGTTGPKVCGGIQGLGCGSGEYCHYPDQQCGSGDQTGVCEPIPETCTEIYQPVCGCDDQTYGNACEAAAKGISVSRAGACDQPFCGGIAGFTCPSGEFCDYPIETQCGSGDQTGVCRPTPQACTKDYRPVCGCDGITYGNRCTANAEGVSVAADGECKNPGGKACGGLLGLSCGEGEYCSYAPGALCGFADATGLCEPIPDVCTLEFAPVCGCNGRTYENRCAAGKAGVSVASEGSCSS